MMQNLYAYKKWKFCMIMLLLDPNSFLFYYNYLLSSWTFWKLRMNFTFLYIIIYLDRTEEWFSVNLFFYCYFLPSYLLINKKHLILFDISLDIYLSTQCIPGIKLLLFNFVLSGSRPTDYISFQYTLTPDKFFIFFSHEYLMVNVSIKIDFDLNLV